MRRHSANARRRRWLSAATDYRAFGLDSSNWEIDRIASNTRSSCVSRKDGRILGVKQRVMVHDAQDAYKIVEVDASTTASELCRAIDQSVDLRYTQLYEELPELPGFGRPVEDHELVISVARKWWAPNWPFEEYQPRYFLTKNPNKYNLHMVNDLLTRNSDSCGGPHSKSNISSDNLSLLSQNSQTRGKQCCIPSYVTSGILWFRLPHKTWRKMYCFLHGSCVFYSLKQNRVSASCMRILVDLSTVDCFQPLVNFKRVHFKAPTSELIVCRPHVSQPVDLKHMIIFACRTPEGRAAWENGFRVHKFGFSRLENNLKNAFLMEPLPNPAEVAEGRKKVTHSSNDEIRTSL